MRRNLQVNERRTSQIISIMTGFNHLWTSLRTSFVVASDPSTRRGTTNPRIYFKYPATDNSTCDCISEGNQCVYPAGAFYNWTVSELDQPIKADPPPLFQVD